MTPSGVLATVAGLGANESGDGGPALNAGFLLTQDLAFDAAGNLYVADVLKIRKISPGGVISTIAGNGSYGYSGDGGPATAASLSLGGISRLTADSTGNLYFVAPNEVRVRKVSATGIITTVAGNGSRGLAGDGGPATAAQFEIPEGLAVDAAGNLYIADSERIRRISATGTITTVAGGVGGYSGDGGPASAAQFNDIQGIAFDGKGNLFVADFGNALVREISAQGLVSTIAGNGYPSYSGSNGPAVSAQLDMPQGIAVDNSGNVYFVDQNNGLVRKIGVDGNITTVAGNGTGGPGRDGAPALLSPFGFMSGIAVAADGSVYFSDFSYATVWKVTPDGILHRVAGGLPRTYSGDGGPALNAGLRLPWGLALDGAGALYIADAGDYRVRKVSSGGIISTIAGDGTGGFSGDGGPATSASLNQPVYVAVDLEENVFIADSNNYRIRKVTKGGAISTYAGNGQTVPAGDGGPAIQASMPSPRGIALDGSGNLFIAASPEIRKITAGTISTVAGAFPLVPDYADSVPATNYSVTAEGLAVGATGIVYFTDNLDLSVRRLQPYTSLAVVMRRAMFPARSLRARLSLYTARTSGRRNSRSRRRMERGYSSRDSAGRTSR